MPACRPVGRSPGWRTGSVQHSGVDAVREHTKDAADALHLTKQLLAGDCTRALVYTNVGDTTAGRDVVEGVQGMGHSEGQGMDKRNQEEKRERREDSVGKKEGVRGST